MTSFSKIRFFLITFTLTIILSSCNKKNDVIPDTYVNFTIDINDPEFINLSGPGGSAIVTSSTNNLGQKAAGFDGNGIIIYRGTDEFFAYDRTCPHDYALNGQSVKVKVDFTIAICPQCSTAYALSSYGTPAYGIGRYPLKNYKTSFDGRFVSVWNY